MPTRRYSKTKLNTGVCLFLHFFSCLFSSCKCQTDGDIRLAAGLSSNSGRVEIYHSGQWGTVCDDSWDDVDAGVVCRQLGFHLGVTAFIKAAFETGVGPIWLDQLQCIGNETTLAKCSNNGWGIHDCSHEEDASVICGDIRLVGGYSTYEGRVEVYHDNQWGTVCDDGWSDVDASIVCRQLGLSSGAKAYSSAHFGQGSGPIWLDDVECTGNEGNLTDCRNPGWAINDCSHSEDAGVVCGRIRLVEGASINQGRVEVHHIRQWGTICDDLWDDLDASVVCRQLGFKTGATAVGEASFGKGSGPIWMDNIQCTGMEGLIEDCSGNDWGAGNCEHTEDAGVICSDVRLSGGSLFLEGHVEVFHEGKWGRVCDENWDDTDASVVCRQLGYSMTGTAVHHANFGRLDSTFGSRTWIGDVKCKGNESSLLDCDHFGWAVRDCTIIKEAGVICRNGSSICSSKPCLNGGSCIGQPYEYICICLNGFQGESCEIDTSICLSKPCLNGGSCIGQPYGYICICLNGFQGENCEIDTSICSSKPCLNGGSCIGQPYGYICICLNGFQGENCEIENTENLQGNPAGLVTIVVINTTLYCLLLGVIIILVIWVKKRQTTASPASTTANRNLTCVEMQPRHTEKNPSDRWKNYYKDKGESVPKYDEEDDMYEAAQFYENVKDVSKKYKTNHFR